MTWTMRYAALLAALVLALGLVAIMRPGAAAADGDEVMLPAPTTRGDPDQPGGVRGPVTNWVYWWNSAKQSLQRARPSVTLTSQSVNPTSSARQVRTQRR